IPTPDSSRPPCVAGAKIAAMHSCSLGTVVFTPTAPGPRTITVTATTTGGGSYTHTITASAAETVYSWVEGEFGECTGGAGSWQLGDWLPASGCGPTVQHRTVTCAVESGSGTQSR